MNPPIHHQAILYLHDDDLLHPSWVIDHNVTVRGDPARLRQYAAERRQWKVLVPGADVLLTHIQLPKMQRAQLKVALPFALEDRLATDIETVHVAYHLKNKAAQAKQHTYAVAVVSHEKMKAWCALLHEWRITPHTMLPVTLALPHAASTWTMAALDAAIMVRVSEDLAFACDHGNTMHFLQQAATLVGPPSCLHLLGPQASAAAHALKTSWQPDVKVVIEQHAMDEYLKSFADTQSTEPPINLLQGVYAVKAVAVNKSSSHSRLLFRLICVWLTLMFLYPTLSYLILHHRDQALAAHIQTMYATYFPDAKQMVAPALRMEEKSQQLSAQGADDPALMLIAKVGEAMQSTFKLQAAIQLRSLDYSAEHLTLNLIAPNVADFTQFVNQLKQQRLQVQQQNVTFDGHALHASLMVTT